MKIHTRAEFLAIDTPVVFSRTSTNPNSLLQQDLHMKVQESYDNDFVYIDLAAFGTYEHSENPTETIDAVLHGGQPAPFDPEGTQRDGCFATDEQYLVWDKADVAKLIELLKGAL